MLTLYKNDRNIRFVLFTKTSIEVYKELVSRTKIIPDCILKFEVGEESKIVGGKFVLNTSIWHK